tara:strand:- start:621 stop:761 length:141 start_codon:yes stop_codon:yes gene_type:complete
VWEKGNAVSMVAMPWSLGHPAIAYGIRVDSPMREFQLIQANMEKLM